ncbi:MAG: hypothetical protein ABI557_09635, partial [Aureliella sp.]
GFRASGVAGPTANKGGNLVAIGRTHRWAYAPRHRSQPTGGQRRPSWCVCLSFEPPAFDADPSDLLSPWLRELDVFTRSWRYHYLPQPFCRLAIALARRKVQAGSQIVDTRQ